MGKGNALGYLDHASVAVGVLGVLIIVFVPWAAPWDLTDCKQPLRGAGR